MCYSSLVKPSRTPIGLQLSRVSKAVSLAFDAALAQAGGSRPTWLVLLSLKAGRASNQRELAEAVGIQGATLTHHLNAMESAGLLARRRDPQNRRVHIVELSEEGESLFRRLREVAAAFDKRLRAGFADAEIEAAAAFLQRLERNVAGETSPDELNCLSPSHC
jgi:MarR family transcriptional regulator for hemolysin